MSIDDSDEECKNLIVVNDGGELTRNIKQKKFKKNLMNLVHCQKQLECHQHILNKI